MNYKVLLPITEFVLANLERLQLESIGFKDDLVRINRSRVVGIPKGSQFCIRCAVPREAQGCGDIRCGQQHVIHHKWLFVDRYVV